MSENEIIMASKVQPAPRHARESGHPEDVALSSGIWILVLAGMTKTGYPPAGKPYALFILTFETLLIHFWTRVYLCPILTYSTFVLSEFRGFVIICFGI